MAAEGDVLAGSRAVPDAKAAHSHAAPGVATREFPLPVSAQTISPDTCRTTHHSRNRVSAPNSLGR